jgi:5-methylcytosine-specific restriction endonuclease McrA
MSGRGLNKRMDTLFPQEHPEKCRVCNEDVVDGRWNYCSERCRDIAQAVQRMFLWDTVRKAVFERDDYTCQECGLSRERWKRADYQVREIIDEKTNHLREAKRFDEWREERRRLDSRYGISDEWASGGFHADHIQRIADGGHKFDESNLQTLCKFCHEEKTAEENSDKGMPEVTLEDYLNA